ncbi:MAG TPA: alpha-L-rhamnosidase, partial [Verrucomicrobiota bacterium]|nr:alpha-L-rhamnosidase [Verrucomicrobiota bacterium]
MRTLTVAVPLMLLAAHASAAPALSLTVGEGFANPLGFHDPTPVFSWKLPAGVVRQTAYRIETRTGDKTWDSGWVESDQSVFVPYGGEPFVSRDRVEWRVRFRDENGNDSGWSAPAQFELGLLSARDWKAQWIRPVGETDPDKKAAAWLRRAFTLPGNVSRARLYVTARGVFQLRLNGNRVGND